MLCLRTSVSMHRLQQRFSIIDKKTNEGIIIKHCVCPLYCLRSAWGLQWAFITYSKGSPSLTRRPMKVLSLNTVSALFIVYTLFGEFIEHSLPTAKVLHHWQQDQWRYYHYTLCLLSSLSTLYSGSSVSVYCLHQNSPSFTTRPMAVL